MKKLTGMTLLLGVVLTLAHATVFAQGRWIRLAPFPEASEELLGASAGGKLYVFAGLAPGYKSKGLVYEYDPATDKWTKNKPMALASHHVALAEHNGKIYAFGGFVLPQSGPPSWVPINNAFEYDPGADSWKALAPMPSKRGAAVAAAAGGKLYVIGGASMHPGSTEPAVLGNRPHRALSTVEEYDPAANTWRERSAMPTARNHAAAGSVGGKIYVIGGRVGSAFVSVLSSNVTTVEEYDPATDQWGILKAPMPTARSAVASAVHNGKIYVVGGEMRNEQMFAAFRAFEGYDPVANRWTVMPPMAVPRHGLAAAVVGNRMHLVSGDVQSAGGISGVKVDIDLHDAYEFENTAK